MEVIPAYEKLLGEDDDLMRSLEKYEPSCSGLVLELGLDRKYPAARPSQFLFLRSSEEHFHTVFRKRQLPPDPTIYLVAASRTDPTVAPEGCDCLKILPHIPHIDDDHPLTREDYMAFKERVLDKLERMGLKDLRKHVVFEHCWTPIDIREQYHSNKGSIYGVVSDRFKNLAFKAPKQSIEVSEPVLRRRLSEPRRRHADGGALRAERREESRGMGPLIPFVLALWALGFLLLPRLRSCRGGGRPAPAASLSIIIPARNEAHNLPTLLESFAAQAVRPHEIIVVDDGSSDGTAELARDAGAMVIVSKPLPDGWRGKTWACQQGAEPRPAGYFVSWMRTPGSNPAGSRGCLPVMRAARSRSVHGMRCGSPMRILSLFFNLNMVAGTVPDGLFGQLLLVDRESYWRVGGHATVRGKILENFRLAGISAMQASQCGAWQAGACCRSGCIRTGCAIWWKAGPRDLRPERGKPRVAPCG